MTTKNTLETEFFEHHIGKFAPFPVDFMSNFIKSNIFL